MSSDASQGIGTGSNMRCTSCGEASGPNHQCKNPFQALLGTVVDGRYQIKKILGQGGMGVVFLATQTSMNRDLAMKMLHPTLATTSLFAERFRREAEVVSRLKHPHIISIYDFGQTPEGHFYYTMELLEGDNLKAQVKREGPMQLGRAVAIVEQIAGALGYAHAQNILHRDMKPHNVMCAPVSGKDFVKVLDFGLVKLVDEENNEEHLTTTGQILGTPAYMSPEQAAGDPLDGRSDLYSLAVVLYYLLAGSTPYKANSAQKLLALAMGGEMPSIKDRRQGAPVPDAMEGFIKRALSYHREDRPADVDAWIAELQSAISDAPKSVLEAMPEGAVAPVADQRSITSKRVPGQSKSGSGKSGTPSSGAAVFAGPGAAPAGSGRSLVMGACIGLGVLGVAGAAWVFLKPAPIPPVALRPAEPPPPVELAKPAEPTKPQPPAMASVKVTSDPPGASIFDGADLLGVAPASLLLPRSRGGVNLTLRLAGYTPQTQSVDLSKDPDVVVKLSADGSAAAKGDDGHKKSGHKTGKSDIPVFE